MSASEPSQVTPTQLLSVRSASIFESAVQQVCVLDDVSKELASTLDYEATLLSVAHLAVAALADWCAVDIVEDDGSIQRLAVGHADPAKEGLAWEHARRYPPSPTALRGVAKVLRTGHSALIPEMTDAAFDSNPRDDAELLLLRQLDLTSGIMVPLVARDRTLGHQATEEIGFGKDLD